MEVFFESKCYQRVIRKTLEKSLEIEGKKASKRDPKGLPKHPKNLSKNKPEKTWKKEGLRVT